MQRKEAEKEQSPISPDEQITKYFESAEDNLLDERSF